MVLQKRKRVTILGFSVCAFSFKEAVDSVVERIEKGKKTLVFTPNLHHAYLFERDRRFSVAYRKADLVFADGASIVWLSWLCGEPLPERINGTNLMMKLLRVSALRGYKVFFLGGNSRMAQRFKAHIPLQFPTLEFDFFIPPWRQKFTKKDNEKMTQAVNAFHPDILFVGLGAPKQEVFLAKNKRNLKMSVGIGVGGSFEYLAGTKIRAWGILQYIGLEWFIRLVQEPVRLWRRYLTEDLPFLVKMFSRVGARRLRAML